MPNTPDKWEITATFHEGERADFWRQALGSETVPIVSPLPKHCKLPHFGVQPCVMLDLKAISSEMRRAVITGLASRFGVPPGQVEAEMDDMGMPIMLEHVSITCADQGMMLSMAELGAELAAAEEDAC